MASDFYITAQETNGESQSISIDMPPQECPICHRGQKPADVNYHYLVAEPKDGLQLLESVYRCTFADCERTFISRYAVIISKGKARFVQSLPQNFQNKKWDEAIKTVSPEFVSIYDQAHQAESHELDKVAGPGYRKALEFLIKDWLIANKVDTEDMIKSKLLGQCIKDYLNEAHIKAVAARAAWLGNDETHFYRKWTGKDINDLKSLIELTANWININELSNAVIKDMPEENLPKQSK